MVNNIIIETIRNKYKNECMTKQLLDEAQKMIINYFQELKIYIQDMEKELNGKISLKINQDENLVEFKIEKEYVIFKRYEESIKVLMSNCVNDIPECENDEFTVIVPDKNFHGCKYGGYKFQYVDINYMISKAFKSLNLNL